MENSTHLNIGNNNNHVAFLFSCPGHEEEKIRKPVAGKTGENLDILLNYLESKDKNNFQFRDRYSYRITNSWNKVVYKKETNRTEAKISEIKQEKNLKRIKTELKDMKILVLFGNKAQKIIKFLNFEGIVIESKHLSMQALAGIDKDIHGNKLKIKAEGNTQKRIEVIASSILKQIKLRSQ